MPLNSVAPLVVAIARRVHNAKATIGSRARRSWTTNDAAATKQTAAASKAKRPSDAPASVSATINEAIATVNRPAPTTSTLRSLVVTLSRRNRKKPTAAASPIGTFIQKIHAQLTCWMINPPASGPITDDTPQTLANQPCTLPRSCAA